MKTIAVSVFAVTLGLAPMVASAQFYEYGPSRHQQRHEHVEIDRYGDHGHVKVRRHHGDHDDVREPVIERRHDHHYDADE